MKHCIRERRLMLFARRLFYRAFAADPFRLPPTAAACVLIGLLRRMGLKNIELATAQVNTFWPRFLTIDARGAQRTQSRAARSQARISEQNLFR